MGNGTKESKISKNGDVFYGWPLQHKVPQIRALSTSILFQRVIRFHQNWDDNGKSNHNLIKNWDENWKIKCILKFFFTISRTMLNFIQYKKIFQNFIFSSSCNYPEIATFLGKRVSCIQWVRVCTMKFSKNPNTSQNILSFKIFFLLFGRHKYIICTCLCEPRFGYYGNDKFYLEPSFQIYFYHNTVSNLILQRGEMRIIQYDTFVFFDL